MKNTKKLFCLLLALACLGSVGLTGCGDVAIENELTPSQTVASTIASTTAATNPTSIATTAPATEFTSTKSTTAPTTAPTTMPTTKPITKPTVKPTTAPTTKATAKPTTAPTTTPTVPAETVHTHSWEEATCTTSKTCTACGATEGSTLEKPGKENYHGHVYTGGESSKKYHYEEKCPGKNSHEITWEEVERRNLGPCGTCVLK